MDPTILPLSSNPPLANTYCSPSLNGPILMTLPRRLVNSSEYTRLSQPPKSSLCTDAPVPLPFSLANTR